MDNLNEKVTNPNLKSAIELLKKSETKESKILFFTELNQSRYLIPIVANSIETDGSTEDIKKIKQGSLIKFIAVKGSDGKLILPAFTDWDAIKKYIKQPVDVVVFEPKKIWSFVLQMGDYNGVILNPGTDNIPLEVGLIGYLNSVLYQ